MLSGAASRTYAIFSGLVVRYWSRVRRVRQAGVGVGRAAHEQAGGVADRDLDLGNAGVERSDDADDIRVVDEGGHVLAALGRIVGAVDGVVLAIERDRVAGDGAGGVGLLDRKLDAVLWSARRWRSRRRSSAARSRSRSSCRPPATRRSTSRPRTRARTRRRSPLPSLNFIQVLLRLVARDSGDARSVLTRRSRPRRRVHSPAPETRMRRPPNGGPGTRVMVRCGRRPGFRHGRRAGCRRSDDV